MTFVIGDIHGEVTKLRQLISRLEKLGISHLIFLGDYVDKGENSKQTLRLLQQISIKHHCTFLIGNHEYAWLRYVKCGEYENFIRKYGGETTIRDFKIKKLTPMNAYQQLYLPHKDFFQNLKKYTTQGDFFIAHAGINPRCIKMKSWRSISPEEFVFKRLEFLNYKGLARGKRFIFGHTAFQEPFYDGFKIGIDTGAVLGKRNPLTAFAIEKEFFINNLGNEQELSDLDIEKNSDIINNLLTGNEQ